LRAVMVGKTWFAGSDFQRLLLLSRRFNTPASIWRSCVGRLLGMACGGAQRPRDSHGARRTVVRQVGRKHPWARIVKGSSRGGDARAVGVRDRRVLHNVTRRCSSRSLLSCQARQALSFHDRRRCPSPGEYLRFRAIHSHGQIECSFRRGKPVRLLVPSGTFVLEVDIK